MEASTYERFTYKESLEIQSDLFKCSVNAVRYPSVQLTKSYVYFWLGTVFSQLTYGLAIDTLLRVVGQKPR